jgi:glycosyltransferase involved in cell wall biosynthesis
VKILYIAPSNSVHAVRWITQAIESEIDCALFDLVAEAQPPSELAISEHFTYKKPAGVLHKVPVIGEIVEMSKQYKALRAAAVKFSPDAIHCHWLFHSVPFLATFLKLAPLISTPWGSDLQLPVRPLRRRVKKVIANRLLTKRIIVKSIAFCCDSRKLSSILKERGATSEPRIIYFGTDTSKFSSLNRSQEIRTKFGAREGDLLVISNRSHEELYDIQTLIRAAVIVRANNTKVRFVIAGSGSQTTTLINLVKELRLEEAFYFTGRLSDEEFVGATASCDIYVSTSTSDGGLAASTAEAMACEVPVIITEFGENADWLCEERAGLLFPIGDSANLAKKILDLAGSDDLRRQMGAVGRSKILIDNNSDLEWKKVLKMYREVTA